MAFCEAFSTVFLGVLLLVSGAYGAADPFSYSEQNIWPGICVVGNEMRQSPINIVGADVEENSDLIDLDLEGWGTEYDGTFSNTGHNVQFDPDTPGLATVSNHLGTFELQQFHMHWGSATGQGSEHRINGNQAELEIHFVLLKQVDYDEYSVISVLGDVDVDAPVTGPWAQLNVTAIQSYTNNTAYTSVSDFQFDQLLPDDLDYMYYEGSLTTPPCTEAVFWFVLKERISVPGAYLELLRGVEDDQGTLLTFNFRMEQAIGDRTVTMMPSGAGPTAHAGLSTVLLATALALVKVFC